jgi:hypothetical protein
MAAAQKKRKDFFIGKVLDLGQNYTNFPNNTKSALQNLGMRFCLDNR